MDVKFLTAEEEKELVIKAHAGDIAARNAVISNIDPFIWKMASKLAKGDPEKAEIYHAEAVTVLCKKFHNYDVSFGCKFITWASAWIYQSIKRYRIDNEHGGIRLPPHYAWQEGGDPHVQQARRICSTEAEVQTKGKSLKLSSIIPDYRHSSPDSDALRADRIALVREVLQKLQPRYAEILMLRTSMHLEEVGKKLGVTRERIRQLEAKAMDKFIETANRIAPNQINELETEIRESNRTFAARFLRRVNMNMTAQDEQYGTDSQPKRNGSRSQIIENVVRELGVDATYKQIKDHLVASHNIHTYDAAISKARREVFGDAAVNSNRGKRKPWHDVTPKPTQDKPPAKSYAVVNGKGEMELLRAVKDLSKQCGGLNELARMVEFLQELAS